MAKGLRVDNERDADGRILCAVCKSVIFDPERSPIIRGKRVHSQCWSPPYEPPAAASN